MKSVISVFSILAALIMPLFLTISCSDDDDDEGNSNGLSSFEQQIVGVWENTGTGDYYYFYADHSLKMTMTLGSSAYYTGTWSVSGDNMTANFKCVNKKENDFQWNVKVEVNGKEMRFTFTDDEFTVDFVKVMDFSADNDVPSNAIDLGLSVRWASCNLGADKPEGFGYHLEWGSTTVGGEGLSDYQSSIICTKYDAAYVKLGKKWRLPGEEELYELVKLCVWTFTSVNGVSGYMVTGPSGNSIFLPAAGRINDRSEAYTGYYWSGQYDEKGYCTSLRFTKEWHRVDSDMPIDGLSIRPVYGDI